MIISNKWFFFTPYYAMRQWYCELSTLCNEGSPHIKSWGGVKIIGLPVKRWLLRWPFLYCREIWWSIPTAAEKCTLAVWSTSDNALVESWHWSVLKTIFEHNFAPLVMFCGPSRIFYHTELKIFVLNLHPNQYLVCKLEWHINMMYWVITDTLGF